MMNKYCPFLNPLQRDGTSQHQRLLDALLPENNPIDERNLEDLLDYLHQYARLLLYYDVNDFPAGNWQDFIKLEPLGESSAHPPHMALLLAFLQLFKYLQEHLNSLTAKHLDFYYEDTLQLLRKKEQPDQVHLVFELAKQIDQHRLNKDVAFKAGKDALGKNRFYASDDELVINQAVLSEEHGLKTVFVDTTDSGDITGIHEAAYADSSDGLGAPIEDEEGKWATFGNNTMPDARIGFAVASPMFYLAEGTRHIYIRFYLQTLPAENKENKENKENIIKENIKVLFSGEKEWLPHKLENVSISIEPDEVTEPGDIEDPPPLGGIGSIGGIGGIVGTIKPIFPEPPGVVHVSPITLPDFSLGRHRSLVRPRSTTRGKIKTGRSYIEFHILLKPEDEPIVAYNDAVLLDGFASSQPIAKLLLDPPKDSEGKNASYIYDYLHQLNIQSLEIRVDVRGVKNLILENDSGVLNPAKPFLPFGPVPKKGSKFYIGSNEVFQKSLQTIDLDVRWGDLPEESFKSYYSAYKKNNVPIVGNNCDFKAELSLLGNGEWIVEKYTDSKGVEHNQKKKLFNSCEGAIDTKRLFTYQKSAARPAVVTPFTQYEVNRQYGFLRMELLTSFLHNLYPTVLADAITNKGTIPNTPYTPLMTELTLNYTAKEFIDYSSLDTSKNNVKVEVEQLFYITPFGYVEFMPITSSAPHTAITASHHLLTDFPVTNDGNTYAEGTLYLGIEKLKPPQNLSILFQVAESSADPGSKAPTVYWSYMVNNRWKAFADAEILADNTNGLLTSGIIRFAIPKAITNNNSLLPGGLHWLKASVKENTASISKLIAVKPQAVVASFHNDGNDLSHLGSALPAETISKLKQRDTKIKSLSQPFASFGGQLPERDHAFYRRVSERLRHKGRAITIFDYERLVLEQFPAIYKVKCINHTQENNEFSPGNVRLVVVPDLRNKNAVNPLRPRATVNMLQEIERYISGLSSDFVNIEVSNPQYEEIRVSLKVAFHEGYDQGFYLQQLELDIIKFLSPWLYDDAADISFGGRIHRTWILNHVEEQEYVDFVTDFRMDHLLESLSETSGSQIGSRLDVEETIVQSSSSVLVSSKAHIIKLANQPVCENETFGEDDA